MRSDLSVPIGTLGVTFRVAAANQPPQFLEPVARPHKFDCKNRQPDGNEDERRARRHYHDDAQQQHTGPDDSDNDATTGSVREVDGPFNQRRFSIDASPGTSGFVARHHLPLRRHNSCRLDSRTRARHLDRYGPRSSCAAVQARL